MTFKTEKNKLEKLWNNTEKNSNNIITQKDNNNFIIENIDGLNKKNTSFPVLINFSSDWLVPTILMGVNNAGEAIIDGNYQEFKLTFNNLNENFIPYVHGEIIYRVGQNGQIPMIYNPFGADIPFDEEIGQFNMLQNNELWQINENNIEYMTYMRMDFFTSNPQEVEYKFLCYVSNPHYYN